MAIALACLALTTMGAAQLRDRTEHKPPPTDDSQSKINAKADKHGPRAIAVVEFMPGGAARLVPIALWINDRFYDASLYGANPEPMALEPDTVYEATDYGEPTGLFTVTTPGQIKGSWVAEGKWKAHLVMDEKLAQQAAKQPKPKPTLADGSADRPVLKRGGSGGSSGASGSDSSTTASSASTSGGSGASGGSVAPNPNDPPDRPTLKKSTPPPAPAADTSTTGSAGSNSAASEQAATAATAATEQNAPGRPMLRRGKQPDQPSTAATANAAAAKAASPVEVAQSKMMTTLASLGKKSYPAISYAGKYETRSLLYSMSSSERTEKANQLRDLAMAEIRKFVSTRHTPAPAKTATITDFELRAFDLDYSNSPTFVYSARLPVENAKALRGGEFDYFVTVVAREDTSGAPIRIFGSVTDSNHLDSFSRMEVIDAVDADGNGRGDLLFRQYSDVGIDYSLFRVYPYEMQKVFEGGSSL